jgi:hypothetical protein
MYGATCQNTNMERAFGAWKKTVLYTVTLAGLRSTESEKWATLVATQNSATRYQTWSYELEDSSKSSTTPRRHCCTNWHHRWWKLNSITWEIGCFCFTSFRLKGSIWWMNCACKLRDCCICAQLHIWILPPPTGIRQLVPHPRAHSVNLATHPQLICNLQHTTGGCDDGPTWHTQQLAIFNCAGPACSWWDEWLAERTAHKHTSGLTQNQSHRHGHCTLDSANALSPNPPASTTITGFNYCACSFWTPICSLVYLTMPNFINRIIYIYVFMTLLP